MKTFVHKRGSQTDTIETDEAITYVCPKCANVKNIFLKDDPSIEHMAPGARLQNGLISSHPWMQTCKCMVSSTKVDVAAILMELHRSLSTNCETLDDAIRLVWSLASKEEMKS